MQISGLIDEELVLFTNEKEKEALLGEIADLLEKKGIVKDTYKEAVIAREKVFPTGLETEHIGIAIPHTDSIHVNEPAIAIAILDDQASFIQMGSENDSVDVSIVFMLAIKKAEDQLEMLQTLIDLIQDEDRMAELKSASTAEAVIESIRAYEAAKTE